MDMYNIKKLFEKNPQFGYGFVEKVKFKIFNLKFKKNQQLIIKFIDGSDLLLGLNGGSISSSLIKTGNYSLKLIEDFSSKCFNKNNLILNIGANIGTTARNLKYLGFKNIIAFEPVFENFLILKKNTNFQEINSYNISLGNESGIKDINKNLESNGRNSFLRKYSQQDTEKVIIIKLDELKLHPKYIFMDVEGYELEVLEGSVNTLKSVDALCLEMSLKDKDRTEKVVSILTKYFEQFQVFNMDSYYGIDNLKDYIGKLNLDQIDLILFNKFR